jgi:hypothetical protein
MWLSWCVSCATRNTNFFNSLTFVLLVKERNSVSHYSSNFQNLNIHTIFHPCTYKYTLPFHPDLLITVEHNTTFCFICLSVGCINSFEPWLPYVLSTSLPTYFWHIIKNHYNYKYAYPCIEFWAH